MYLAVYQLPKSLAEPAAYACLFVGGHCSSNQKQRRAGPKGFKLSRPAIIRVLHVSECYINPPKCPSTSGQQSECNRLFQSSVGPLLMLTLVLAFVDVNTS